MHSPLFLLLLALLAPSLVSGSAPELIQNGGFEDVKEGRPTGWTELWTRDRAQGESALDSEVVRSGKHAIRIIHRGARDWSLNTTRRLPVRAGNLYRLEAWVRLEGRGSATLCVVTYDGEGQVLDWTAGARTVQATAAWRRLSSRVWIPEGVTGILPRLIGVGPATVRADDVSLKLEGNLTDTIRRGELPASLKLENDLLSVRLQAADATLEVTDKRTDRTWRQRPAAREGVLIRAALDVKKSPKRMEATWIHFPSGLDIRVGIELDSVGPEVLVTLSADGELPGPVGFPHPFQSEEGFHLVVPMNEGISWPVGDRDIRPRRLIGYGGHGICMGFWGVTDGTEGHLAIIETPDDAAIQVRRLDGLLCIAPEWDPQRGRFGPPRRLRYVFLDRGGHVAQCKRYRAHAESQGLVKTLEEKRAENPHVDLLVGAANIWCWERDALHFVREMKSLGMERILWSRRQDPDTIATMNALGGVLTSRYDIYQDLMDPEIVAQKLRGRHPDWTQEGWPRDLMLDSQGNWRHGWRVQGRDGGMYPCGVLCDRRAPAYARKRIGEELKNHAYRCRFIDTTTASPWRECYHPDHPMTRSQSRRWKMELLRVVSEEMKLVTGSETGHEAAVPWVHYFEGMLSLGPYRIPDAGRRMLTPVLEVPERVAKFQVGEKYRLPLWELVYHDCVVAHWYWGDYNNKLPALWDKRDLFNILYGTPPMLMFDREIWENNRDRFVRTCRNVCPVARATGYAEMTDHRFLTPDRSVQQTVFSGGMTITVNFGESPFSLPGDTVVEGGSYHVEGLPR